MTRLKSAFPTDNLDLRSRVAAGKLIAVSSEDSAVSVREASRIGTGASVLIGEVLSRLLGDRTGATWLKFPDFLERLSSRCRVTSLFVCTCYCSAGGFSDLTLGRFIRRGQPPHRRFRLVIGEPDEDSYIAVSRLMLKLGRSSPASIGDYVHAPTADSNIPRLHAKFILFSLATGHRIAVLGSSNASFGGYVENLELNVALAWRSGDPWHLCAVADQIWSDTAPIDLSRLRPVRGAATARLKPFRWQRSRVGQIEIQWELCRRSKPAAFGTLVGRTLEMPPGTGKTLIAAEFLRTVLAAGGRVLWLVHRRELLIQAFATLGRQLGTLERVQVWGAGLASGLADPPCVYLATDAGLRRNLSLASRHEFDIVVIDEVHRYGAARYFAIGRRVRAKLLLGLSATPARRGSDAAAKEFRARFPPTMAIGRMSLSEAFRLKQRHQFVLPRVRHVSVDSGWVMTAGSDDPWTLHMEERRQLRQFARHFTPMVVAVFEALITRYSESLGKIGPTLFFAANIEHARALERSLTSLLGSLRLSHWVRQYHSEIVIHERSRARELEGIRDEFQERAARGEDPILVGVDIIAEGFDLPCVQTVVLSRPTISLRLYTQMIGRGLRGPALGGGSYCNFVHFGAQTEIGGQSGRSFADLRDVLAIDLPRVQHLRDLESRLTVDPRVRRARSLAQAQLRSRGSRRTR